MLHIHLFGYLRLLVDGEPYRFRGLPKTTSLLAYLLLNRDTAVSREHLAFLLWDDVSEDEARANLRRHLHDLTKQLPPGEDWLLRDMKTVQWNSAAPAWLDIAEFESLCRQKDRLTEAVAIYTGDLLQNSYEDWLIAERERYKSLFLTTLSNLIAREWERGDLYQAMIYARQLLNQDPLREDVLRDYMRLRHASGDRASALQLYQQFKERLEEELGVEPMPETAELYEQLSTSQSAIVLPKSHPLQPPTAPPPSAPPHNLPARITSFVGRQEELAQVCHLIGSPGSQVRLLTITGPGGTGKTRLALEAGTWLWENQPQTFPEGIYFVGFATLASPERMLATIIETLSLKGNPNLDDLDNLKECLREKKLLLLLDNFEHMLEQAELLSELLTAVPGLRLLVTSQATLHLYGEYEYPLSPLPLPQADKLPSPAELLNYPAIHLFIDRLHAVQPQFRLTAENSGYVTEICRCLDGMPLALELAAARGNRFSPAAMLSQLTQRLQFLTSQMRNRPSRHQTLRATIDWSYNLLTTAEQRLFAGTSIFAGLFTIEAAQAIFSNTDLNPLKNGSKENLSEDIPELLYSLVDRNMLRALPVENAQEQSFRMLQTLREYGLDKLRGMETADLYHQQYALYYVKLAEAGYEGLKSNQQSHWIQAIKQEAGNLLVALDWLFSRQDNEWEVILLARMVRSLARFWISQGWMSEIIQWIERLRPLLPQLPPTLRVHLLNEMGNAYQNKGDFAAGEAASREALSIARQATAPSLVAYTLPFLGLIAGRQGNYEEAKHFFQECLILYRQLPEITTMHITRVLNNLAIVHKRLGEYDEAVKLLEELVPMKRQIGDYLGLPASLANLGNLLILQGKPEAAGDHFREALEIRQRTQDRQGMLYSVNQMASLAVALGRYEQGAALYAAADALHEEMSFSRAADEENDKERDMVKIQAYLAPEVLAERQAVGAGLSLEEACELALE